MNFVLINALFVMSCVTGIWAEWAVSSESVEGVDSNSNSNEVLPTVGAGGNVGGPFNSRGGLSSNVNCQFVSANYRVSWTVDSSDRVHFDLSVADFPAANSWTGLAFGQSMNSGLDVILVRSNGGSVTVTDEHVMGQTASRPDGRNDVITTRAALDGNTLVARFSRPLKGSEGSYIDKDLDGCVPWHFVVNGGGLNGDGTPRMHSRDPVGMIVCNIKNNCPA